MATDLQEKSAWLAARIGAVSERAENEEQLKHEAETLLRGACEDLGIRWTPFQLERTLRGVIPKRIRYADVVHGAVVIEYEPPGSFGGREGAALAKARRQAEEYTELLQVEEGRPLAEYVLVSWDGAEVSFGHHDGGGFRWDTLRSFDREAAARLLGHLRDDGIPLVHAQLLRDQVGPGSLVGEALLPRLFDSAQAAASSPRQTKTTLLFTEWRRLFGQVVGDPSERLQRHLRQIGEAHERPYSEDPPAYLFALNTQIAIVAKLVAALALPGASEDVADPSVPIAERMRQLESGRLFLDAGIENMLSSDFFSWYADDGHWPLLEQPLADLLNTLGGINFDVGRKQPEATRDLFKGLYMTFAPPALRHALGEYYTPDWLAAHALDRAGWEPSQSLLDPTCGSGTYLLEGLKRRVLAAPEASAEELLRGIYGFDLNPLAVLAAKASLVVFIGKRLDPTAPIVVPVYLADAINPAVPRAGLYEHRIQTERGARSFRMPRRLVEDRSFFGLMQGVQERIDDGAGLAEIEAGLAGSAGYSALDEDERAAVHDSVEELLAMREQRWDGIWSAVLCDRFLAGATPPVDVVVGNPPWVKWSHLPPEYAEFIKPLCEELGIFSDDSWVGGIESDISTVVTYTSLRRFCRRGGTLAFLITGTVFSTESSQGFRRWTIEGADGGREPFRVEAVEDFAALAPFEGVNNHPTLLLLRRSGEETAYPLPYRRWRPKEGGTRRYSELASPAELVETSSCEELLAKPMPGTDGGPWLKGTAAEQAVWEGLFDAGGEQAFRARKGITTDANGIYFLGVLGDGGDGLVEVRNNPSLGKRDVAERTGRVEAEHLFPLLKGKGIAAFRAEPEEGLSVLLPQRGMHGDPDLPRSAPGAHRFLRRFEEVLRTRGSYRLYQSRHPYWSVWSTGPYTFAPYKVVWKEMSGGRFVAAYVGPVEHPDLGRRVVVPDHKVYFVPCEGEDEAAFLTGLLNAPTVAGGVNAYGAALSLGVSVVEYLRLPSFAPADPAHREVVELAKEATASGPGPELYQRLEALVPRLIRRG